MDEKQTNNTDRHTPLENKDLNKTFEGSIVWQIVRVIVSILGAAIGPALILVLQSGFSVDLLSKLLGSEYNKLLIYIISALIFGFIFYFSSPAIIRGFSNTLKSLQASLNKIPMADLMVGSFGGIIGLIIAFLLSYLVDLFTLPQNIKAFISAGLFIMFGILGWSLMIERREEIIDLVSGKRKKTNRKGDQASSFTEDAMPKILDTSVIIDGRILDIARTGIIEGKIIIPNFILQELRHVSDSADSLKRVRGRRGLDILHKMQTELDITIEVTDIDYENIAEVDAKLLKLGEEINGMVLTNDFNLNKVATVQGVPILNINDLANAVKTVVIPGESIDIEIVSAGKEPGQGLGYLEDGTMIVVDGGSKFLGEKKKVVVTSVLQTSAGRMLFVKIDD